MTFQQVAFIIISALTLSSAVVVVTNRNLFRAAIALMASFLGVAGLYILLDAGFLAVAQIIVYIGAISILIIFAIMAASSWRHAYLWLAGLTFICIVVPSALYIRRRPEDMGLHPDGMAPDAVPSEGTSNSSRPSRGRQEPA